MQINLLRIAWLRCECHDALREERVDDAHKFMDPRILAMNSGILPVPRLRYADTICGKRSLTRYNERKLESGRKSMRELLLSCDLSATTALIGSAAPFPKDSSLIVRQT